MDSFKEGLLAHLEQIAFFMECRGENPFKIRAFGRAVEILEGLENKELEKKTEDGSLLELKGIGKGLLSTIQEFSKKKTTKDYAEARGNLPESLFDLRLIRGLGPKKIKVLYDELQITSVGELEYACHENRLAALKGFGEKTQFNVLKQIESMKARAGKLLLSDALDLNESILKDAEAQGLDLVAVGDLGAKREIVEKMEYLAPAEKLFQKMLSRLPSIKELEEIEKNAWKVETSLGVPAFIHTTPKEKMVFESIRLTSSERHWKSLESAALKKQKTKLENIKANSEEEFYSALNLPFYSSEEREFPAEKEKTLLNAKDLKGVFHVHTKESDGIHTLEQMISAAQKLGLEYFGLSDHSKSSFYARGLEEDRVRSQWKEIDEFNKQNKKFRVFKGIEADILKDGSLDYTPSFLKNFEFVIASIHQRFGMKEMTARLIKAIENPATTFIGHISGRLLLARDAYDFDVKKVIDAAIANQTAIELNSHPQRLDLDWRVAHEGAERGLLTSINPDAHSMEGLSDIRFGIWMAKKAQIPTELVVNTWPQEKLENFLGSKKN